MKFPHYQQLDAMDCGPTCLRMVARFYGKSYSLQFLRTRSYITPNGASLQLVPTFARLVNHEEDYPYSSAVDYSGKKGLVEIVKMY